MTHRQLAQIKSDVTELNSTNRYMEKSKTQKFNKILEIL